MQEIHCSNPPVATGICDPKVEISQKHFTFFVIIAIIFIIIIIVIIIVIVIIISAVKNYQNYYCQRY